MARQSRERSLPPVLLTRPAAQADRFAAQLRDRFGPHLRILIAPLTRTEFLSPALPATLRGVIFTSESGVEGFLRLWSGAPLPAWCVGDHTASVARAAGFAARSAGGDAAALIAAIAADAPTGPLLHARGRDTRGDVAGRLTALGLRVDQAIVYAQAELPLTEAALDLLRGTAPVVVPLFSPRAAQLFLRAARHRAPLWIVAISPAVADIAMAAGPDRLAIADNAEAEAMVAATARLIDAAAQP